MNRKIVPALYCLFTLMPALACLFGFLFTAGAVGPLPWTANQFPFWYATQANPVAVTNTTESLLYQTPVPVGVVGSQGFMRVTLFLNGDGVGNNHTVKVYLGGTGTNIPPTGATALWTNTFTTTQGQPLVAYMLPTASANTNRVWASTTTNSYSAVTVLGASVGTGTNNLSLTVTGSNQYSTNYLVLDGIIVEALQQ